MIIVWRGYGLVTPFVFGLAAYLPYLGLEQLLGGGYLHHHVWPLAASVLIGGLATFAFGRWLDRDEPGHSLYFIPVKYWGILAVAAGIGLFFSKPAAQSAGSVSARGTGAPAKAQAPAARPRN